MKSSGELKTEKEDHPKIQMQLYNSYKKQNTYQDFPLIKLSSQIILTLFQAKSQILYNLMGTLFRLYL